MGCGNSIKSCNEPKRMDVELEKPHSNLYIAESDSQPEKNSKELVVPENNNLQLQNSPTKSIVHIITKA